MSNKDLHSELIFVGYTNGDQISYANEGEKGEGLLFGNSDNNCHIPLYMIKVHAHRIQTTSITGFNLEKLKNLKEIRSSGLKCKQ